MTIDEAKQAALAGFEQAKKDIDAAQAAHADALSRLNYFKGAHEAVSQITLKVSEPAAAPDPDASADHG